MLDGRMVGGCAEGKSWRKQDQLELARIGKLLFGAELSPRRLKQAEVMRLNESQPDLEFAGRSHVKHQPLFSTSCTTVREIPAIERPLF